jgi:hypothetical protein
MTDVNYTSDERALLFVDRPAGQHVRRIDRLFRDGAGLSRDPGEGCDGGIQQERLRAAHELNGPNFAHAIVTTDEMLAALSTRPEALTPRPSAAKKLRLR